jgi:hypothetical protein
LAHEVAQLSELDLALDELRVRSDDHARIVLRRDPLCAGSRRSSSQTTEDGTL